MTDAIYHRAELANLLVNRLLHPSEWDRTTRNGLFISGIRGIGKTTFLKQDLIPALLENGALVIYMDLWDSRGSLSPAKTITSAIHETLLKITTGETAIGERQTSSVLASVSFEPGKAGLAEDTSLSKVFLGLIEKLNCNIVLIIDEIQEILKSRSGSDLLKSLKAARDAVNLRCNSNGTYLLIVGTGSHRSLIYEMCSKLSQPFYGADRMDFPVPGEDFILWQVKQLPENSRIPSIETLTSGFQILRHRPRYFINILKDIQSYRGSDLDNVFLAICQHKAREDARNFLKEIESSDALTRLLFSRIAKAGSEGCGSLFSARFCEELRSKLPRRKRIAPSSIQEKIERMISKDLIFPAGYGSYAVSDPLAASLWLSDYDMD